MSDSRPVEAARQGELNLGQIRQKRKAFLQKKCSDRAQTHLFAAKITSSQTIAAECHSTLVRRCSASNF